MSKRNFILLTIVLTTALVATLGFLYLREEKPTTPGGEITGTNFFSQFNPFGESESTPPKPEPPIDVSGYVPPTETEPTGKLRKISSMPVAGYGTYVKERIKTVEGSEELKPKTEFVTAVRYVEKAKGFIYQTFADKVDERKFSQTLIPKVHDAYFGNKAGTVVMRYLKDDQRTIETFVGTLPKENLGDTATNNEIKGYFLPKNILDISVSQDGTKVFYLFTSGNAGDTTIGTVLNLLNNSKVQVFDSPFTEWLGVWGGNTIVTLTTKPSNSIPGYAYTLDIAKKGLTKVLGDINGLGALPSPNGKLILYSDAALSLFIHHSDTRITDTVAVRTLPEKCVWGAVSDAIYCAVPKSAGSGGYPDSWYQGEVSFDDQIWKIDVKTGNASIVLDPKIEAAGEEIDATKLALDEGEDYLFFINKKDSFLWKLDLN